MPSLSP
jgi:hypothetical protein